MDIDVWYAEIQPTPDLANISSSSSVRSIISGSSSSKFNSKIIHQLTDVDVKIIRLHYEK